MIDRGTVLIIAEPTDIHARVVARRLEQIDEVPIIVSTEDFGTRVESSITLGGGSAGQFVLRCDEWSVDSSSLKGVWLRRPRMFDVRPEVVDSVVRKFSRDEIREMFLGLVYQCPNVMNAPGAEVAAIRKPFQLHCAERVGLRVPRTLVSNDPAEIEKFYRACDRKMIFKILSNTEFQFTETRRFEDAHLGLLDSAVFAPTIYQELIQPRAHLRCTVVDEQVFSVQLMTSRPEAELDWRLDGVYVDTLTARDLGDAMNTKILELQRALGLRYGAIDFIEDESGELYFLENNPGGQFLFAEIHAGVPISKAMASALRRN